MHKIIKNKLAGDIYLPSINRRVLILGKEPKFWQRFLIALVPVLLLGFAFEAVLIFLSIYGIIFFWVILRGDVYAKALERGQYFYQEEQEFYKKQKGRKIALHPSELRKMIEN